MPRGSYDSLLFQERTLTPNVPRPHRYIVSGLTLSLGSQFSGLTGLNILQY